MQVLEIIQRACRGIGISAPSTAVANPAEDIQQLVELLNQTGRDLVTRHEWTFMRVEAAFTTVATELQGTMTAITGSQFYGFKSIVNETMWNRTTQQPIFGPVTPSQWQGRKALSLTGPYCEYRIRGDQNFGESMLYLYPAPTAGHSVYFEYSFKWFATEDTSIASLTENIANDSDTIIFDGSLMIAGLDWRWRRAKGLSYAEEFASYEQLVAAAIKNDGTHARLNMAGPRDRFRPGVFVPIGSWTV